MEWQPINTAPKDGTPVLGFEAGRYGFMLPVIWEDFWGWHLHGCVFSDESIEVQPTHWMPLPEPPDA